MSFFELATFLQTQSVENEVLQLGIEKLEDEIKKKIQLQQNELINLEEKYHNLMKTHVLDVVEKNGRKYEKMDALRQKLGAACQKITSSYAQAHQQQPPKVQVMTDPVKPKEEMQVLMELRQKKREMYQELEKRSVVEKLSQKLNSTIEEKASAYEIESRKPNYENLFQISCERNFGRVEKLHADAYSNLFNMAQKIVGGKSILGTSTEHEKNTVLSEIDEQTKFQLDDSAKASFSKPSSFLESFLSKDLFKIDTTWQNLPKFNIAQNIKYPLDNLGEHLMVFSKRFDKANSITRRVQLKEQEQHKGAPPTENLNEGHNADENVQMPKSRSYTILPTFERENDIKMEKSFERPYIASNLLTTPRAIERFTKKQKMVLDVFQESKLSKKPMINNYNEKETLLSEAITNKKIDVNNFLEDEHVKRSLKRKYM